MLIIATIPIFTFPNLRMVSTHSVGDFGTTSAWVRDFEVIQLNYHFFLLFLLLHASNILVHTEFVQAFDPISIIYHKFLSHH